MSDLPHPDFSVRPDDSAPLLRLQAENPFYQARAARCQAITDLIQELESQPAPTRPTTKLLISLRLRREKLLAEMLEMLRQTQDRTSIATIWRQPTHPPWRWN